MRYLGYLTVGSSISFIMLTGAVIRATSSPNVDSYIRVDQDYNDFPLTQFDSRSLINQLEQEIDYGDTQDTLEEFDFNYNMASYPETKQSNEKWKLELLCATNPQTPVEQCDVVAQREVKYLKDLELVIFIMKNLYCLNNYPSLFGFILLVIMPFFFKMKAIDLVK